MQQAKVPVIGPIELYRAQINGAEGYLYQPNSVIQDRFSALIGILHAEGWFGSNPKVGVVMSNGNGNRDQQFYNNVWKPELAAYGIKVVSTFTLDTSQGTNTATQISSATTQSQSLVVQFRGAGVDHVLFVPGDGNVDAVLGRVAANQKWFPQWELVSADTPRNALLLAPASELQRTTLFGYSPYYDNNNTNGVPNNSAVQGCASIYPLSTWASDAFPPVFWCDALFFAQQALSHAAGFSVSHFLSGVNALGSSFQSASGLGPTQFGPGRYDGVVEGRFATFQPSLKDFIYTGSPVTIP
jgi:hypothetical protein